MLLQAVVACKDDDGNNLYVARAKYNNQVRNISSSCEEIHGIWLFKFFLDALASLELDMTLTGSPIFFREILDQSVKKTFRQTDLKTIQPYNLTT